MAKKIKEYFLEIFNTDKISFQEVTALFKSCGMSSLQAEQCALIIHTKGKYAPFKGPYDEMKSIQLMLRDYEIHSEIISDEKTKTIKTKN